MKKQTSGKVRPGTEGQVAEVFSGIMKVILETLFSLSFEQFKWLTGHGKQLANAIRDAIYSLVGAVQELPDHLKWWQDFYWEEGIKIDFLTFRIPEKPVKGSWWPILVAAGLTYNQVVQMLRKKFPVWLWTEDLDKAIDLSKEQRRAVDQPYVVWVKANVEADPDLANKSANDLVGQKMITLMERLLLEVLYFCAINSGQHLDIQNWTLCAGSRCQDGVVPGVSFRSHGVKVSVYWTRTVPAFDDLRARSAV